MTCFSKIIDMTIIIEYADIMKKTLLFYPAIFILTAVVCLLFMLGAAMIPQEAVQANAKQSAQYFKEHELFEMEAGDLVNFKKDNYADCISTGIAYHLGNGNVWTAVISADYNSVADENVNDSFYREMNGETVETESYARYWHGSAGLIRLLMVCMDIQTIRYVITAAGILLNGTATIVLMRKGHKALGILYTFSFLLVNGIFGLNCLEYAFIFLLMPLAVMFLVQNKKMAEGMYVPLAFMVIGMLTAYFDFLTAETLTFTVPFAIYYIAVWNANKTNSHKDKKNADWLFLLRSGVSWYTGYGGMFLLKWLLAWATLGRDALLTAADMAMERISGDVSLTLNMAGQEATFLQRIAGIWQRNTGCLLWGRLDMTPTTLIMITAVVILVPGIFWYMARKQKASYNKAGVLIAVAFLPYLRFLVLSNHSFIHYFFTYRAQMVTVLIGLYLIYRTTILSEPKKKGKK